VKVLNGRRRFVEGRIDMVDCVVDVGKEKEPEEGMKNMKKREENEECSEATIYQLSSP
jgi:hypothetical protein